MAKPDRRHDRRARRGAVRAVGRRAGAANSSASCATTASSCSAATPRSPRPSAQGTVARRPDRQRRHRRREANGGKIEAVLPDQDGVIGTLMVPTTVGLDRGASVARRRRSKLIDYLLSREVEQKLIDAKFAGWSVRELDAAKVKAMEVDYARGRRSRCRAPCARRRRSSRGGSDARLHAAPPAVATRPSRSAAAQRDPGSGVDRAVSAAACRSRGSLADRREPAGARRSLARRVSPGAARPHAPLQRLRRR